MFNLQAIVFLTVLYAVNAAMVVSVYDDGSSEKQNINNCMYRECDQLCRRIGFPGGACVGDRCKCDIIQDVTAKSKVAGCYFPDCNNDCIQRGFDGGYCWADRCKCVTYNKSNEDVVFQMSMKEINTCYNGQCEEICRHLGFISGGCSKGYCRCRITSQVDDKITNMEKNSHYDEMVSNNKIDECSSSSCKMSCQVEGHPGGSCVNDRCVCRKKETKHLNMLGDCTNPTCNNFCISLNWFGGFCIGLVCVCY